MNNLQHHEMVKQAVKCKFYGHDRLCSKYTPKYPDSAEREYKRVTNAYLRLMNKSLKEHLPEIMAAYKRERRGDSRFDDIRDFETELKRIFMKIAAEVEQKFYKFGLEELVRKISRMTKNLSLNEWKKAVKNTLGIDLMSDYYNGDFYASTLQRWVDENVLKIKSVPRDSLDSMQSIILQGYRNGMTIRDVTKAIQNEYGISRRKAQSLARDQLSTLNSQITKMQQQDAGCTHYKWSDSRDSRVRDCHRSLNGQIFSWDAPPEMWYMRKSGIVYTGRRCHPGEDYACRCVAIPVFDIETIDVPMKETNRPKE